MIALGERIKQLRASDGRTQEALAQALGVTAQAVSRWEKGICYPDMEMVPAIANYFGVSIDRLFGYDNERERKERDLIERINALNARNAGVDVCMDECIALAREALCEFPSSEGLTLALASVLFNAGYVRYGEHHLDDEEGYGVYDIARHRGYAEWQEAVKLYERLLPTLEDGPARCQAVRELSQLYKNLGLRDKALALADTAPDLEGSKPLLRLKAYDGKDAVRAAGQALVTLLHSSAELIARIVLADGNLAPQEAADALKGAVGLFDQACPQDYGDEAGLMACLEMLRSYYLWRAGDRDGAFLALDHAGDLAKGFDALSGGNHTTPILRLVGEGSAPKDSAFSAELPNLWPWWDVREQVEVKAEITKDPRWRAWVRKVKA